MGCHICCWLSCYDAVGGVADGATNVAYGDDAGSSTGGAANSTSGGAMNAATDNAAAGAASEMIALMVVVTE
jgi:hypothetical protein